MAKAKHKPRRHTHKLQEETGHHIPGVDEIHCDCGDVPKELDGKRAILRNFVERAPGQGGHWGSLLVHATVADLKANRRVFPIDEAGTHTLVLVVLDDKDPKHPKFRLFKHIGSHAR